MVTAIGYENIAVGGVGVGVGVIDGGRPRCWHGI